MKPLRLLQRRIIATNLFFVLILLLGILTALFLNTRARSMKEAGRYLAAELRFARFYALLIGCISFFGILFAMLLAWTSHDALWIEGVQGRYFLPLLPVFLFGLQNKTVQSELPFKRLVPYGFVILNLCVGIRIFALAVLRV